jgi:hypothetical protein
MLREKLRSAVYGILARTINLLFLAGVLAVALSSLARADGGRSCSLSTFKGVYSLEVLGLIINEPSVPVQGPIGRVGRAESDGNGNIKFTFQLASYSGVPSNEPAVGTYTVTPDCFITFYINAPPPVSFLVTFQGTILANGDYLTFMQINPQGTTVKGNSKRVQNVCTFEDLKGDYNLEMRGTIMPHMVIPLPPPIGTVTIGNDAIAGDYAELGLLTFEPPVGLDRLSGKPGKVTAKTNTSFNGNLDVESWSGTYVVSSNCLVSVNFSRNAGAAGKLDFQWQAVLADQGRDLRIISTPLTLGPMVGDAYFSSK